MTHPITTTDPIHTAMLLHVAEAVRTVAGFCPPTLTVTWDAEGGHIDPKELTGACLEPLGAWDLEDGARRHLETLTALFADRSSPHGDGEVVFAVPPLAPAAPHGDSVFILLRTWAGRGGIHAVRPSADACRTLAYHDALEHSAPEGGDTVPGSETDLVWRRRDPHGAAAAWTCAWDDLTYDIEEWPTEPRA